MQILLKKFPTANFTKIAFYLKGMIVFTTICPHFVLNFGGINVRPTPASKPLDKFEHLLLALKQFKTAQFNFIISRSSLDINEK